MNKIRPLHSIALLILILSLFGVTGVSAAPAPPEWNPFLPAGLTPASPLFAVCAPAINDAWAVGVAGGVYHFNGSKWSQITSNTTFDLEGVAPVPGVANTAVVVGLNAGGASSPSTVLTCTLSGCTQDVSAPHAGNLDSVWVVGQNDFWVAGGDNSQGVIYHHQSSPAGWSADMATGQLDVHYHGIYMLNDSEGYAVGEMAGNPAGPGTLVHYSNGAWAAVDTSPLALTGPLHGVWFISPTEGWVVGGNLDTSTNPDIGHYTVGGWTRETVQGLDVTHQTLLWFVSMNADGSGYAAGNGGIILQRDPNTSIWTPAFSSQFGEPLYGVWVVPGGEFGWAVGGLETGAGLLDRLSPPPQLWLPLVR